MRTAAALSTALLLTSGTLGAGAAQSTSVRSLVPGDDSISGSHIKPYENEWEMVQRGTDGEERVIGRWTDRVEIEEVLGREVLRREQVSYGPSDVENNRQVHVLWRDTLAPVRSHLQAGPMVKHVDFGAAVGAHLVRGPDLPALSAEAQPLHVFDFEAAGLLLVGMRPQAGEQLQFRSYELAPAGVGPDAGLMIVAVDVVAQAHDWSSVAAGNLGALRALRVNVQQGQRAMTFWLAEAEPYVIKLEVATPSGTTIWRMR
ncbi:MAG: hypothetical protein GKS06_19970 [Acidobacteria bacterium]|nr:hypothetical protein [Acidobacteriota bacterium]